MAMHMGAAEQVPARLRLHYLDGIRGLAAMYVLIFHSLRLVVPRPDDGLSIPLRSLRALFGYGHSAVAVFIVLSGFSLALPLARRNSLSLDRGFRTYMIRRSRRVLPPYYAALVLSIIAVIGSTAVPGASTEGRSVALSPGSLVSHALLIHNWNFDWVFRINGPMWSVATEWQIYFLFPLVLLPLWRRFGALTTVTLAWAVPLAAHFSLPDTGNFAWAAPWFVGSFALGVWGAFIAFGPLDAATIRLRRVPWGWVSLSLGVVLVVVLAAADPVWPLPILDLIVSLMSVAFIVWCCQSTTAKSGVASSRGVASVLGSQRLVALGAYSYSLYLLQHPLLRLSEAVLGRTTLGLEEILWVQLVVGTALIMLASRIFAEFFEMPFTTGSRVLQRFQRRRQRGTVSHNMHRESNADV